jgi:hypothetical protein
MNKISFMIKLLRIETALCITYFIPKYRGLRHRKRTFCITLRNMQKYIIYASVRYINFMQIHLSLYVYF